MMNKNGILAKILLVNNWNFFKNVV